MKPILVTGATGTVGSEVVKCLLAAGAPVRAASTHPERDQEAFFKLGLAEGNSVRLRFGEASDYVSAFENTEKMFLMRPPQITNISRDMVPALEVAKAQGVKHVVFMSLQGVEKNRLVPHRKVEDYLKTSGFTYTFLRPSFFMQNLSGVHAEDIRERGEIYVPAGSGKTSFIDARDIAAVAAKVLLEDGHAQKAYELTGSAALSYREAARIMSDVLKRDIIYADPNPVAFFQHMRSQSLPAGYILVMIALYTVCRLGLAARVTPETEQLLGRGPISFAQFVADYRDTFTPA